MNLYKTNKKVFLFRETSSEFLRNYGSNTLEEPRSAFVDIKGKIVATFDQICLSLDEVLVVIEEWPQADFQSHLEKYMAFSQLEFVPTDHLVYFDLDDQYECRDEEVGIPQKRGRLILTKKQLKATVSSDQFTIFRLENNIPLQGVDYHREMLLNVSPVEFASFTKGCYLGQEILSRVHFKSQPPCKLVVKKEDDCTKEEIERMTSRVFDPQTGQWSGFVFVKSKEG